MRGVQKIVPSTVVAVIIGLTQDATGDSAAERVFKRLLAHKPKIAEVFDLARDESTAVGTLALTVRCRKEIYVLRATDSPSMFEVSRMPVPLDENNPGSMTTLSASDTRRVLVGVEPQACYEGTVVIGRRPAGVWFLIDRAARVSDVWMVGADGKRQPRSE